MDKINQNWSFEVVTVPQDNNKNLPATNTTPMKVKIRVKKGENTADPFQGIISVPKFKNKKYAEKIRVVHSDQTIMSFNMLTETEHALKSSPKSQNKFFHIFKTGKCLGAKSEDEKDPPYMISCSENSEALSKATGNEKRNISLLGNNSDVKNSKEVTKYPIYFLGKCKPGGCLDPPFGEDKYQYKPPFQSKLLILNETEKSKELISENPNENKSKNSETSVHSIAKADYNETSSTLMIYKAKSEKSSLQEKYSDSIITYPPEPLPTILDKSVMSRKTSAVKSRQASNDTDTYYIPTKSNLERNKNSISINNNERVLSKEFPLRFVKQNFGLVENNANSYNSYTSSEPPKSEVRPELNLLQKSEINSNIFSSDLEIKESNASFRIKNDKDQELECKEVVKNKMTEPLANKANIINIYQLDPKSEQNGDISSKHLVSSDTSLQSLGADMHLAIKKASYDVTMDVLQTSIDHVIPKYNDYTQNLKLVNQDQISLVIEEKKHNNSIESKETVILLDNNEAQSADLNSLIMYVTENTKDAIESDSDGSLTNKDFKNFTKDIVDIAKTTVEEPITDKTQKDDHLSTMVCSKTLKGVCTDQTIMLDEARYNGMDSTLQEKLNPLEHLLHSTYSHQMEVDKFDALYSLDLESDEIKSIEGDNINHTLNFTNQEEKALRERFLTSNGNTSKTNSGDTGNLNLNINEKDRRINIENRIEKESSSNNLSPERDISSYSEIAKLNSKFEEKDLTAISSPNVKELNESYETVSIENYIKNMIKNDIIANYNNYITRDLQNQRIINNNFEHFNEDITFLDVLKLKDTQSLPELKSISIDRLNLKTNIICDFDNDRQDSSIYQSNGDVKNAPLDLESHSCISTINCDTLAKKLSLNSKSHLNISLQSIKQNIVKPIEISTTNNKLTEREKESPIFPKIKDYNLKNDNKEAKNVNWISSEQAYKKNNFLSNGNNNSSTKMIVDLAFQTFINESNETVLKTFDISKEPQRFPNDKVSIITSRLNINERKKLLAVNSKTNLYIEINYDGDNIFEDNTEGYRYDLDNKTYRSKTNLKSLQESLAAVYEKDLVPVEKLIKGLTQEVEKISKFRVLLKKSIAMKKPRLLKPTYTSKCGCLKK